MTPRADPSPWQRRFVHWAIRRQPPAAAHRLHRKNLYLLPTRAGYAFLLLTFVIWLLGTNYQNNLILALAYLQIGLFVVTILNTYHNMAGLTVQLAGADSGFAGERIAFHLQLTARNRAGACGLTARWLGGEVHRLDVLPDADTGAAENPLPDRRERLPLLAHRRGRLIPGPLYLESRYPMGLLRCWTWLPLTASTWVYPAPLACSLPVAAGGQADASAQGPAHPTAQGDEFSGLRVYAPGDRHIAWKAYARGQGLWTRQYSDTLSDHLWLDWQDFFHGDAETALSHLCYQVLQFDRAERAFGLRLPGRTLALGQGAEHRQQALRMLAEWEGRD